jgi:DNA-binding phage protein
MVNDIKSSPPITSQRSAAFTRLVSRVLEALNGAVDDRRSEGHTLSSISAKIGRDRSALTRALNGTSGNLTLRTISDILWATNYDPRDFTADPIEKISPNWVSETTDEIEMIIHKPMVMQTYTFKMAAGDLSQMYTNSAFQKPEFEIATR